MTTITSTQQPKCKTNGARGKILRALQQEGMMCTTELSEHTGLPHKQVLGNAAEARLEGLILTLIDEVTGTLAYQLTSAGVEYLIRNVQSHDSPEPLLAEDSVPSSDLPEGASSPADPDEDEEAIDYPEISPSNAAQPPLYGVDAEEHGVVDLCGADIEAAIAQAIRTAELTGVSASVYRLIKIGVARATITYEEHSA